MNLYFYINQSFSNIQVNTVLDQFQNTGSSIPNLPDMAKEPFVVLNV